MRRIVLFLVLLLVFSMFAVSVLAQSTTSTPEPPTQAQSGNQANTTAATAAPTNQVQTNNQANTTAATAVPTNQAQTNNQTNTAGNNQAGQQTIRVRIADFVAD